MSDKIEIRELFENIPPLFKIFFRDKNYPWEAVADIGRLIPCADLCSYTEISKNVFVGKNVRISPLATVMPPAIIGDNTEIRQGALLRGNTVIGEGCVIGNSTEIKNSLLLDHAAAPHYNYIGDSIIGNYAHLGAGVILSNLKSDKTDIRIKGEKTYDTCMRKLGSVIGDRAEIGCGCVLNPGTVVGKDTVIYPLNSVRGVIPSCHIVKGSDVTVKKQTLSR